MQLAEFPIGGVCGGLGRGQAQGYRAQPLPPPPGRPLLLLTLSLPALGLSLGDACQLLLCPAWAIPRPGLRDEEWGGG